MITSKTEKRKYAIETISENREKSGKIGEKVDFFKGGVCKSVHCIIGKSKKIRFDFIQSNYGVVI